MRTRVALRRLWAQPIRHGLMLAATYVIAIGLLAVGMSGLLAAGADALWGNRFVAGDLPGVTYTASRCAEFREYAPHARTCLEAAASHHAGEVIDYRLAAGILGLGVLAMWAWLRRRDPGQVLPAVVVPAVATAVFAAAAAALFGQGLGSLILNADHGGAGQWLSGAVVAALVAAWFVRQLLRALPDVLDPTTHVVGLWARDTEESESLDRVRDE